MFHARADKHNAQPHVVNVIRSAKWRAARGLGWGWGDDANPAEMEASLRGSLENGVTNNAGLQRRWKESRAGISGGNEDAFYCDSAVLHFQRQKRIRQELLSNPIPMTTKSRTPATVRNCSHCHSVTIRTYCWVRFVKCMDWHLLQRRSKRDGNNFLCGRVGNGNEICGDERRWMQFCVPTQVSIQQKPFLYRVLIPLNRVTSHVLIQLRQCMACSGGLESECGDGSGREFARCCP